MHLHYAVAGRVLQLIGLLLLGGWAHAQTPANAKTPDSPPMSAYLGATLRDPLENYYDNTLVCAAAKDGQDLCHLWLYRDGSFINFDGNAAHTGHYSVGPVRADGKVPVCQYWDSARNVNPPELLTPMGPPPATTPSAATPAPAAPQGVMICKNNDFRTDCYRGVDPASLSAADRTQANQTMGDRFFNGMCYPLGPHNVGDVWYEDDDPLPGQWGLDKLFLLPGRQ